MAKYKCKNFGSCSTADTGKEFDVPSGSDAKCEECGTTLTPLEGDASSAGEKAKGAPKVVFAALAIAALGAAGFVAWKVMSPTPIVIRPEAVLEGAAVTPKVVAPAPATAGVLKPAEPAPSPVLAREMEARRNCEEATLAKASNAVKMCDRAAAIVLMNSGVNSAIAGKLDDAEKDYLAAKGKDAEFPELYFNLAVLKARQGKGAEALDLLLSAESKGFTQFSAISKEPDLQKLKSDPILKAKLEILEAKAK